MLLKNMVPDGEHPNMLVDPAWRDVFHPSKRPMELTDAQVLRRTAPELDPDTSSPGPSLAESLGFDTYFGGET